MDPNGSPALTLGTAGHIDHGKTALVEALTGVNTDRLPEEKARGMSIDLGFAEVRLGSGRTLSVVDVPGHERFVRTMVAGATGIDLFLLVVAADDGVMPQTREHLAVLQMLGVRHGVVAVTKTDVVGTEEAELAVDEVVGALGGTPFEGASVVQVCAPKRVGLDALRATLDAEAGKVTERGESASRGARLHVDRSFSVAGMGTVVTGTLWSGTFHSGDTVRIEPGGRTARIRGLEVHGRRVESAGAGRRVALNLAGVERPEVARGHVVVGQDTETCSTYIVDGAIELLPSARALGLGTRVQVHHGTRDCAARLAPLEGEVIAPGGRAYVQLRLEQPIVAASGDRFVLRQVAPPDTIGGGVVIDASPRKHGAGALHVGRLRLLETGDDLARTEAELEGSLSGMGEREAEPALLVRLAAAGRAVAAGRSVRRWFSPPRLEEARERLLAELAEHGAGRPVSRGAIADAAGLSDLAAGALLEDLVAEGKVLARGPGFRAAAETSLDPLSERAVEALGQDHLEPRGPEALGAGLGAPTKEVRGALERAALEGCLVRLKPGVYYHPRALGEAEQMVRSLCERDGAVTIAGLRDELGASRKYAQALLEHFDARRLTRREGDEHVLRGRAAGPSV